jgi:hypothetical protein
MSSKNKQGNKRQLYKEKVEEFLFIWSQVVYQKQHAVDIKLDLMFACVMSCTNLTLSRTAASDSVKDNHKKRAREQRMTSHHFMSHERIRQVLLQAVTRNGAAVDPEAQSVHTKTFMLIVVAEISGTIHRLKLKLKAISKDGSSSVFRCIGKRAELYLVSPSNNQQALDINLR